MGDNNKFKDTLNLPKTDLPMRAGLIAKEPEIISKWEKEDTYKDRLRKNKGNERYFLHDGPPYPNGNIHLGHALNKILKDIVIKYHLLKGNYIPFVPGWDCHGLPIETQLLKALKKKEVLNSEIDDFRNQCKEYALEYVETQKQQFDKLGIFGDFENPYLTLTPEYESRVIELFGKLADKDLVYQGKKPIHWCYHCKTALAEAEIEYFDEKSPSIYVKFPLVKDLKGFKKVSLVVWTTTPWTLPANVAVAVSEAFYYKVVKVGSEHLVIVEDLVETVMDKIGAKKYEIVATYQGKELKGIDYTHPFYDRISPVISGHFVSNEDGSGLVHIAPGHGYDDYLVGLENYLPIIMPVDQQGILTEEAQQYDGLSVEEANKVIPQDLEKTNKLLALEVISHSYPHCWRCRKPVIFRATEQWFIAMDNAEKLRQKALKIIGEVKWVPAWGEKRIRSMVENRPDWCISRQRFWGIPIPAFFCEKCGEPHLKGKFNKAVVDVVRKEGTNAWFSKTSEEILSKDINCTKCGYDKFIKDTNIMDVWLESGASHNAVLNEHSELSYPADLYLEGSDQHRGWFQSSLLTAIGANDTAPYKAVLTHGFTVDEKGRKMSKSLGNVIDPLKVIKQHGADILRLWVSSTDFRNDVILSEPIIKQVKDAFTKIRNTTRFLISNLYDFDPNKDNVDDLLEIDKWILAKLDQLVNDVNSFYEEFELHQIYHQIYNFCVVELSSLYLDIQKDNLYCNYKNSKSRRSAQTAIYVIAKTLLKLIAPIISFTAEDIYKYLPGKKMKSIFLEPFPEAVKEDEKVLKKFDQLLTLREQINIELESARKDKVIGSSLDAKVEIITKQNILVAGLEQILIVSKIVITKGEKENIKVSRAEGQKCERCWKHAKLTKEGLCQRCNSVVR